MAKRKINPILEHVPNQLKDKVIYLEQVDIYIVQANPRDLNENPKNWRVHTQRQRATFQAFKQKYGWLGVCLYNLKTNKLLDGHMRVEEAIKNKEPYVPVILKYLDEEEENEVLATLDNIGLLARRNNEALQSLTAANKERLGSIKDKHQQKLAQLNQDLSEIAEEEDSPSVLLPQAKKKIRTPKPKEEEPEDEPDQSYTPDEGVSTSVVEEILNDDVMFPGSSWLGIPELLDSELAGVELLPSRTYVRDSYGEDAYYCISSGPFEEGESIGTIGFYTEDHRFNDAYSNAGNFAEYLRNLNPRSLITPDYSTYSDWPGALRIFSLYRSRWVGRYWQELGFPVIPSIQYLGSEKLTREFALETLPNHCPTLSIQCRKSDNEGLLSFIKLILKVRKPEALLLYGGEEKQKYLHGFLPKGTKYIYLPQYTEKRRKLRARQ